MHLPFLPLPLLPTLFLLPASPLLPLLCFTGSFTDSFSEHLLRAGNVPGKGATAESETLQVYALTRLAWGDHIKSTPGSEKERVKERLRAGGEGDDRG